MINNKKQEKIDEINKMIAKSSVARDKKAKAEILKDGRIQYSIETKTRGGRKYRIKVSFSDILMLLHGKDLRQLSKKYGRLR